MNNGFELTITKTLRIKYISLCVVMGLAFPKKRLVLLLFSQRFRLFSRRHQTEAPSYTPKYVLKSKGKQPEQASGAGLT